MSSASALSLLLFYFYVDILRNALYDYNNIIVERSPENVDIDVNQQVKQNTKRKNYYSTSTRVHIVRTYIISYR